MNVLLLEIPSADHAFRGWLGGKAIREILDLLSIESTYKLILSEDFLLESIKDISDYDVLHIECHSDEEGICYNPTRVDYIEWTDFARKLSETNYLRKKQLVISGCLAGNIRSEAKELVRGRRRFKRVFAFEDEIDYDKAVAVWSGFYYLLSYSDQWQVPKVRQAVKKLRECYDVSLSYFYRSTQPGRVGVFPSRDGE